MKKSLSNALVQRNHKRRAALTAITATRQRLKPANLKQEAKDNIAKKAKAAANTAKQSAYRHRFKLMAATGITLGAGAAALLYTPLKKRLSEDRKE